MNYRPNFAVVAFEQVLDQLSLLIALRCMKKGDKERLRELWFGIMSSTFQKHLHGCSILPEILLRNISDSLKYWSYPTISFCFTCSLTHVRVWVCSSQNFPTGWFTLMWCNKNSETVRTDSPDLLMLASAVCAGRNLNPWLCCFHKLHFQILWPE